MSWSIQVLRSGNVQVISSVSQDIEVGNHEETRGIIGKLTLSLNNGASDYTSVIQDGDELRLFMNSQHYATSQITDIGYSQDLTSTNIIALDWAHYLIGPKVTRRYYGGNDYGLSIGDVIQNYASAIKTTYVFSLQSPIPNPITFNRKEMLDVINELTDASLQDWKVDNNKEFLLFPKNYYPILHDGFTTSQASNTVPWSSVVGTWTLTGTTIQGTSGGKTVNDTSGVWTGNRYMDALLKTDQANPLSDYYIFTQSGKWAIKTGFNNQNVELAVTASTVTSTVTVSTAISANSFHRLETIVTESDVTVIYDGVTTIVNSTLIHPPIGTVGQVELDCFKGVSDFENIRVDLQRMIYLDEPNTEGSFPQQQVEKVSRVTILGGNEWLSDNFTSDLRQWNAPSGWFLQNGLHYSHGSVTSIITSKVRYSDFTYEFSGIPDTGLDLSLVWRYQDSGNYYYFRATELDGSGIWTVHKVRQSVDNLISMGGLNNTNPANAAQRRYGVSVTGGTHEVFYEGGSLYNFSDLDFQRGLVGIMAGSGAYTVGFVNLQTPNKVTGYQEDAILKARWGDKNKQLSFQNIHTASEAWNRAGVELGLLKNPVTRADINFEGSTGVRAPSTAFVAYPASKVSALFKVITVDQILGPDDWRTRVSLLQLSPLVEDFLSKLHKDVIGLAADIEKSDLIMPLLDTFSFSTETIVILKHSGKYLVGSAIVGQAWVIG